MLGKISAIYRYPVKSMAGESLESTAVTTAGVLGDRAWAVRDEVRGGIRGAKKIPALMTLSARYSQPPSELDPGRVEIALPGGEPIEAGASDAGKKLSQALDHEVTLWPLLPADALEHYRRGAPTHDDLETELRAIFGRAPEEPLPDLSLFPKELMEFESPPGTYFDAYPLLLLTQGALDHLQSKAADSIIDVRRFRPNFLIDPESDGGYPELNWRSRRLQIGEVTVDVTLECPRCVMTTHGFADLPKDPRVMRTLVQETGGNLGVYATVAKPGYVGVGDRVEMLV